MLCWQAIPGSMRLAPSAAPTPGHQSGALAMSQSFVLHSSPAKSGGSIRLPLALRWLRAMEMWLARRQGWQDLNSLDDRMLKDVGVTREQALRGARKPFWER